MAFGLRPPAGGGGTIIVGGELGANARTRFEANTTQASEANISSPVLKAETGGFAANINQTNLRADICQI